MNSVEIVAGLSLKNLKPRVWEPTSSYYLPALSAVMVSYADFHRMAASRYTAIEQGLHTYLVSANLFDSLFRSCLGPSLIVF